MCGRSTPHHHNMLWLGLRLEEASRTVFLWGFPSCWVTERERPSSITPGGRSPCRDLLHPTVAVGPEQIDCQMNGNDYQDDDQQHVVVHDAPPFVSSPSGYPRAQCVELGTLVVRFSYDEIEIEEEVSSLGLNSSGGVFLVSSRITARGGVLVLERRFGQQLVRDGLVRWQVPADASIFLHRPPRSNPSGHVRDSYLR